jgi:hypothetical protein
MNEMGQFLNIAGIYKIVYVVSLPFIGAVFAIEVAIIGD